VALDCCCRCSCDEAADEGCSEMHVGDQGCCCLLNECVGLRVEEDKSEMWEVVYLSVFER
jgi:hypothetical protein